jgi:endo-1,3-1,4-beta-glycanase ExoK
MMTKIKKRVAAFVLFLIVFSFISVGTSLKPVASLSADSESQVAASPWHPTGLLPTQNPSQPATNRPLFPPTDSEAAICQVGYHYDDSVGTCVLDRATERPICQEGYHFDNYAGTCVPDSPTPHPACMVGYHYDDNAGTCVPDSQPTQPDSLSCLQSGGHVVTKMCCKSTSDFPKTCVMGACGCSPDNSKETKVCDCGAGKCFDGTSCVDIENDDALKCEQNPGCVWVNGECQCQINPREECEQNPGCVWVNGECQCPTNGECNAAVLIQGRILNILNPCHDFQSGSACRFDVRIIKVLKGNFPNVVSGQIILVSYISGSQKFNAQVGDCVEVCATWDTNLFCGDDIGYIKKIDCSPGPNPCTPGPTGNCKCSDGEIIWNEYLKDDCSKEWIVAEDCKNRGPDWKCENCQCVKTTPKCTPGPTGNCKCLNGEIWNEYQNEDCIKEWRIAEDCKNHGPNWSCENCQCVETIPEKCEDERGFEDTLKSFNEGFWKKSADCGRSDSQSNDCPDHIEFPGGSIMSIRVDKDPCSSSGSECPKKEFFAGGYQTKCKYGYGHLEGYLRPAATNGVVTGFFIYDGYIDKKGESQPRAEIDIEFLGDQKDKMYVNYWWNGIRRMPPVDPINLSFDAPLEWHKYAIDWSKDTIKWKIDGNVVWTEDGKNGWGSNGYKIPSKTPLPTPTGTVILNLYPNKWAGELDYTGPIYAHFKDIKYSPG